MKHLQSEIKLNLIRFISKFLLKLGGRFFLSSSMVSSSRKIADFVLKSAISEDRILELQGFKIKLGDATRYLALVGDYEPSVTNLLKKEVKQGMYVFDLGANIGWFTLVFSKLVGDTGHVYAFEPDPYYFGILKENIELNNLKNVSIYQLAISNKLGIAKFNLNKWFGTFVLESKTITDNQLDVKTISLDDFCKANNVRADFIKMDIEGSEPKAFEGMRSVVLANHGIKIISEFNSYAIIDVGDSPEQYLDALERSGFNINQIDENNPGEFKPARKEKLLKLGKNSVNLYCFMP